MNSTLIPSPAELRAIIAKSGIKNYVVGAHARINPIRLSRLLRGHEPLTPDLVGRILLAVHQEAGREGLGPH